VLGRRYGVAADDLLQAAIARALAPKTKRPKIPVESFLIMTMCSIGSGVARGRARAAERKDDFQYVLRCQYAAASSALGIERQLHTDSERAYYAGLLEEIADGDERLTKLIDGIDQRTRGAKLAKDIGVSQADLASLLRKLKRRAQRVAVRERLYRSQAAEIFDHARA